jgi:hypothetical protein
LTTDADANNICNADTDADADADADAVASLLVLLFTSCVIRSHDAVIDPSWICSNQTNMLPSHHAAMLPHSLTAIVRIHTMICDCIIVSEGSRQEENINMPFHPPLRMCDGAAIEIYIDFVLVKEPLC